MTTGETKWVYSFGAGAAEGRADMRDLLGGKGAGLAEMSNLGLPVPPGFTLTTEICTHFYANGKTYPPDLKKEVDEALAAVERALGAKFGDSAEAAPRIGALGGARLDAGDDGYGAQSRAQRRDRRGPRASERRRALRL